MTNASTPLTVRDVSPGYKATLRALRLVQKGIRKGHIPDQTLMEPNADGSDMILTPLSERIDEALKLATAELV
jgi:hypothetical protein